MHYYQFNIGNYRRDTIHLTPLEHGIYRMLIDTYYLEEKPLSGRIEHIMRTHCIRSTDEVQALENVLADFFEYDESGDCYRHYDCDQHIKKYQDKSEKARKSAEQRWKKEKEQPGSPDKQRDSSERNANGMRTHSERNANHKPITNNHKPITNSKEIRQVSNETDPGQVRAIFDYWLNAMGKGSNTKLTDKRRKCIQARLKDYTEQEIKQAIANCSNSRFHMGQNSNGTVYNDLTLICRNGEKLEWFRDMESAPQGMSQKEVASQRGISEWLNEGVNDEQ